jgi:hypothetical protein
MANVSPQEQSVLDAYSALYNNDRTAALTILRQLGQQHQEQTAGYLNDFREKIERMGAGGKALDIGFRVGDRISSMVLNDIRSLAGGSGGFGEAANEFGKIIGDALGSHMTTNVGKAFAKWGVGGGVELLLRGFGMFEMFRMAGARLAPMITAGRGTVGEGGKESSADFARAGAQAISRIAEIRQQTGASQGAVLGVLTELSRVGVAFDEAGKKATQYALAADMMLNLEPGTAQTIMVSLIRDYGEAWGDVKPILQEVAESAAYWGEVNAENGDGLSSSLKGQANIVNSYQAMAQAMKGTNVDMVGLNKVMLSFRDVMGGIGIRPAAMTATMTDFFKGAMPQGGSVGETFTQTYFFKEMLARTPEGREEMQKGLAYASQHGIDPKFLTVALDQMLGAGSLDTTAHYGNILTGLAAEKSTLSGNEEQKNMYMQIKMQQMHLVSGTKNAYLVLALSDSLRRVQGANPGISMQEAVKLAGKDPSVLAAIPLDQRDKSPEKLLADAFGRGEAVLSVEEKIGLAAERMKPLDWLLRGRPSLGGAPEASPSPVANTTLKPTDGLVTRFLNSVKTALDPGSISGAPIPPPSIIAPPRMSGSNRRHPVASWSHPTSGGTTQTLLSVDDKFLDSDVVSRMMAGIAKVESSGRGDYNAVGVPVTKGRYKGQRAVGRYQVMPGNIPAWSKSALGREVTPEEFAASPELQDKIVKHQVEKYFAKYGSEDDVYSAWLTGKPRRSAGTVSDDLGTNAGTYSARASRAAALGSAAKGSRG